MEIKIPKIGNTVGTIGWLAKGLKSGELFLKEGLIKGSDEHALWLKSKDGKISEYLASRNQFGDREIDGPGGYRINKTHPWPLYSNACIETLKSIVQDWCNECNKASEAEEALNIKIIRIEKD